MLQKLECIFVAVGVDGCESGGGGRGDDDDDADDDDEDDAVANKFDCRCTDAHELASTSRSRVGDDDELPDSSFDDELK